MWSSADPVLAVGRATSGEAERGERERGGSEDSGSGENHGPKTPSSSAISTLCANASNASRSLGLLAVQIVIGYEWFMSGLTKIVRGGFPWSPATASTRASTWTA